MWRAGFQQRRDSIPTFPLVDFMPYSAFSRSEPEFTKVFNKEVDQSVINRLITFGIIAWMIIIITLIVIFVVSFQEHII